ncbi:MAG: twin-arginine translocation signal domain-containing protein [Candidatus Limnocylindria bacterium]
MKRREFLKKAGAGSAALASFPFLAGVAQAHEDDDDGGRTRFYFVALSGVTPTLTGGDSIAMSGFGRFWPDVEGGGEFVHFDGTQIPSPNLIATGRWKATHLISFTETGTWGQFVSGVLTVGAKLIPVGGARIRDATLEIVCNLAPAGISTGGVEGYTLTLPDGTTFSAFSPNIGLTLFTRRP